MKKYITILLSVSLGLILLVGCNKSIDDGTKTSTDENTTVSKEVKIATPDGLPSVAIAKIAKENPQIKEGYNLTYTVEKTSESLSTIVMKEDVDIAIVPSNMAAIAYNKTSNYKIVGTVGMGSFYLVSTEEISDFKDLSGKEVGNTGKGLTPDITVQAVLKEKNINLEDVNFNYVNSASELVPLVATGKINTAFVPEPALTGLMAKNEDVKIIKSLNDGWKEVSGSKQGYPQSTVIVKADFAENNKEFIDAFIGQLSNSIEWANKNHDEVGKYANAIGVSIEAKVISKSIERANLKYVKIKDMVEDYDNYYQKLFEFDAKTLGGKLPDEGIYFIEK